jgi:hypothetical protein
MNRNVCVLYSSENFDARSSVMRMAWLFFCGGIMQKSEHEAQLEGDRVPPQEMGVASSKKKI